MHQDDDDQHRLGPPHAPPRDGWHIAREVPITLILTMFLQTAAGVWALAQMSARLDAAIETVKELKTERYTREDARRDRELMTQLFAAMQLRDAELAGRMDKIEMRDSERVRGGR